LATADPNSVNGFFGFNQNVAAEKSRRENHSMIKTERVLAAARMTRSGLSQWVTSGDVRPAVPGSKSSSAEWHWQQVLGLYIARNSRKRGSSRAACIKAFAFLSGLTEHQIRESCSAGQRYLMLVGVGIVPRLMTDEQCFRNPHLDIGAATKIGVSVVVVDIAVAIAQIDQRLKELDSPTYGPSDSKN
jgi:hypothetical protein